MEVGRDGWGEQEWLAALGMELVLMVPVCSMSEGLVE